MHSLPRAVYAIIRNMAEPQHIALPLKYRPMTFEDVVGQEHVVRTLRHALEAGLKLF